MDYNSVLNPIGRFSKYIFGRHHKSILLGLGLGAIIGGGILFATYEEIESLRSTKMMPLFEILADMNGNHDDNLGFMEMTFFAREIGVDYDDVYRGGLTPWEEDKLIKYVQSDFI